MNKHKYLLPLSLPLVLGTALIAGCNGGQNDSSASNNGAQPAAQAGSAGGAPANSSAQEAAHSDGHAHGEQESAASAMKVDSPSTKLAFASQPTELRAGQPATWTLKITDAKTGAPVQKYDVVHDKQMHFIVVKNDLSWFNHVHPQLKSDGSFVISTVLPRPGGYKLYADYTPTGGKQEVSQHQFATAGATAAPAQASLTPDKMQGPWMVKTVTAHPEAQPDKASGPKYQVALMPMPSPLKAGKDSMLHFQIRDAKGKPISDLQPYLGAMGHAVILSQDTTKYLHSHPMAGGMEGGMAGMDHSKMGGGAMKHEAAQSGGPDVMFHTNFPTAGLYKAWGQFKHRGQIITASFTLNVGEAAPSSTAAASSTSASTSGGHAHGDESQPHSH